MRSFLYGSMSKIFELYVVARLRLTKMEQVDGSEDDDRVTYQQQLDSGRI